jgi:hypothetical protein
MSTRTDANGTIVYGSGLDDHLNLDKSPLEVQIIPKKTTIADLMYRHVLSDYENNKGNWEAESREIGKFEKIVQYMKKLATPDELSRLSAKCPLKKAHKNEEEEQIFSDDFTLGKSLWEKSIKDVARALETSTLKALIVEEKALKVATNDKTTTRKKESTLHAIDRRISQIESKKAKLPVRGTLIGSDSNDIQHGNKRKPSPSFFDPKPSSTTSISHSLISSPTSSSSSSSSSSVFIMISKGLYP